MPFLDGAWKVIRVSQHLFLTADKLKSKPQISIEAEECRYSHVCTVIPINHRALSTPFAYGNQEGGHLALLAVHVAAGIEDFTQTFLLVDEQDEPLFTTLLRPDTRRPVVCEQLTDLYPIVQKSKSWDIKRFYSFC